MKPLGYTAPASTGAAAAAGPLRLVPSLLSLRRFVPTLVELCLADTPVNRGQDSLLDHLELDQPMTITTLADLVAVRASTVSKMADRMVKAGLVMRMQSKADKRHSLLLLTPSGNEAKSAVKNAWLKLEADIRRTLSESDIVRLEAAIAQVDGLLQSRLSRFR